jgi:hypothetical protein
MTPNANPERKVSNKSWIQACLAAVVVSGFFVVLTFLFLSPTGEDEGGLREARLILLGSLQTGFSVVLAYYFGSTQGSAAKTELLANSTPTPNSPVQVTSTSELGMVSVLTDPNLQEIEALQAQLTALQLKGLVTPEDFAENERITRRLDELRNPSTN